LHFAFSIYCTLNGKIDAGSLEVATCAHTHTDALHTHAPFSRRVQHSAIGAAAWKVCVRARGQYKQNKSKKAGDPFNTPCLSVCECVRVFGRPAQHLVVVVVETGELSALFLTCPHGLAWVNR